MADEDELKSGPSWLKSAVKKIYTKIDSKKPVAGSGITVEDGPDGRIVSIDSSKPVTPNSADAIVTREYSVIINGVRYVEGFKCAVTGVYGVTYPKAG